MTDLRIIVGAEAMYVERGGIQSDITPLTADDGPAEVRAKAADLWATIRAIVSWRAWLRHRLVMAAQRRCAARVLATHPGPWFPGPRPDLIAVKPWTQAAAREWFSVPNGVAGRVLKAGTP